VNPPNTTLVAGIAVYIHHVGKGKELKYMFIGNMKGVVWGIMAKLLMKGYELSQLKLDFTSLHSQIHMC
jgi:hypothetical protein